MRYTEISVNGSASDIVKMDDVTITWRMHNGKLYHVRIDIADRSPIIFESKLDNSVDVKRMCGQLQTALVKVEAQVAEAHGEWGTLHRVMESEDIKFEPIILKKILEE